MWLPTCRLLLAAVLLSLLALAASSTSEQEPLKVVQRPRSLSLADTAELLDFHKFLGEIDSTSGKEHTAGMQLTCWLRAHNFTVELQELPPLDSRPHADTRYNVFAYRGTSRETPVLVTSHIDT